MFPNFIIVGAPKAGTTSLCYYLSEHPDVFMSEPKEVNFFSREEIEKQGLYYTDFKAKSLEDYEGIFDGADGVKAIGEGSVSYLFYPETPKKIKEALPDVKIIILLRNPVERAFSHYLMDFRLGLVTDSFEDIVLKTSKNKASVLHYQQYVELGLYYAQVKRYLDVFGIERVKIYFQEDLRGKNDVLISDLYNFLGVDDTYKPDVNKEHNTFTMPKNKIFKALYASERIRLLVTTLFPEKLKGWVKGVALEEKKKPVLSEKTKDVLKNIYLQDIELLEKLLGSNLSVWK